MPRSHLGGHLLSRMLSRHNIWIALVAVGPALLSREERRNAAPTRSMKQDNARCHPCFMEHGSTQCGTRRVRANS